MKILMNSRSACHEGLRAVQQGAEGVARQHRKEQQLQQGAAADGLQRQSALGQQGAQQLVGQGGQQGEPRGIELLGRYIIYKYIIYKYINT